LDRILSVTPLEDLEIKAPLISEDELIITYSNASDIFALPAREELLQLTALGIGSENEIKDPTPFPLSIDEDCFDNDIGNSSKAPACNLKVFKFEPASKTRTNSWLTWRTSSNLHVLQGEPPQTVCYNQQKFVNSC
jgi:hypothetical protein